MVSTAPQSCESWWARLNSLDRTHHLLGRFWATSTRNDTLWTVQHNLFLDIRTFFFSFFFFHTHYSRLAEPACAYYPTYLWSEPFNALLEADSWITMVLNTIAWPHSLLPSAPHSSFSAFYRFLWALAWLFDGYHFQLILLFSFFLSKRCLPKAEGEHNTDLRVWCMDLVRNLSHLFVTCCF